MYNPDIHSVRSGNYHTLTLVTPVATGKEPGDYNDLENKPRINGVELRGDISFEDLGLPDLSNIPEEPLSNDDIDHIIDD